MNTTAMTQPHILQQFNRYAIAKRFTGIQTQLWHYLYWLTYTHGQGVCIPTYHLLETMGISRSQLLRARKVLEAAGCLRVHKKGAQRLHYTVMVEGVIVGDEPEIQKHQGTSGSPSPTKGKPNAQKIKSQPTGVAPQPDIVMNGEIERHIDTFTTQHGYSRKAGRKLLEWYRMRKAHGWTMTVPGFTGTMDSLQTYCSGDEEMLIKIVDRTLHHRWKGFHPYVRDGSVVPKKYNKSPGRLPKYDTKYEDLDFLEW